MIEIKTDQYEYPGIEEKLAETLKVEIGLFNMHIAAFIWILWKNRITGTGDTAGLIDEYF